MQPENRAGTPVDPVPFIVVVGLSFLFCYSHGPIYLMELGAELPGALGYSTMTFLATTGLAYYRFVWTARPDVRGEVPVHLRIRQLVLGGLAVVGVMVLLSLPVLYPYLP